MTTKATTKKATVKATVKATAKKAPVKATSKKAVAKKAPKAAPIKAPAKAPEAVKAPINRLPRMNFEDLGIVGKTITFKDGKTKVKVTGEHTVLFNGEQRAISSVTAELLGREYNVKPGPNWTLGDKTLRSIYREYHLVG